MFQLLLAVIYLSFISLGLPDSLLGSAWPSIYREFHVPVSYAGAISMIICCGTIFSSLQSDRLTRRFGTGAVTAASVAATAAALFGFSYSRSFPALCFFAVPYGLGAGCVDASLNNYVALHYESRHMSWLHCMWGVGASVGPYIMGYALSGGYGWNMGYRVIGFLQAGLSLILFVSLPMWKKCSRTGFGISGEKGEGKSPSVREIFRIPGAVEVIGMFFCYCALETTAGLWASSYLVLHDGIDAKRAAGYAGLFYIGITAGRAVGGFLTKWLDDDGMIRMGQAILGAGLLLLVFPASMMHPAGLVVTGLGCAPIYPSIIHSTPAHFGADRSQAVIGVQMASAYLGSLFMPPAFGMAANHVSISLFPFFLIVFLGAMVLLHEKLLR